MRRAIVTLVCGCVVAGLLAPGTAWGQDGDGSIVAWGYNNYGQCDVPAPNTDFVALAGGEGHSLGIKGYPRGDLDRDGDVDLDDFAAFADCLSGPDVAFAPGCDAADLDGDADEDAMIEYHALCKQRRVALSGVPLLCEQCDRDLTLTHTHC
ncbi:MAG: hypothetical protein KAY37_10555 [Phycisphaerae bacterium]|nr:hypothetical protein [Phycisphaerae bacterium]